MMSTSLLSTGKAGTCRGLVASVQVVYWAPYRSGLYDSITMVGPNGTSTTLIPPYPADLRLSDVCPTACGAVDVGSCAPCAATDTCTEPPSYVVGTRGTTCEEEGLLPLADEWQCLNAHLQTGAPRRAQVCRHTRAERHPSVVPAGSLDGYFQELGVSNYPSGCYHWARAGAGWRVVQMLTLK